MPIAEPPFTIGIEEEYLLVDRASRRLAEPPPALIETCEARIRDLVRPEFLKSQIEVGTRVCRTIGQARDDLAWLRGTVAAAAAEHGLGLVAASTHPFSEWQRPGAYRQGTLPRAGARPAGGSPAACWCAACTSTSASTTTTCAST